MEDLEKSIGIIMAIVFVIVTLPVWIPLAPLVGIVWVGIKLRRKLKKE